MRPCLLPALLLLSCAAPAHSHSIESSLERVSNLTDQLVLESRFGNGQPASDAVVRLMPPGGEPIELGRTDARGQLRFQVPQNATASWEVQVDQGPGHQDYLELPGTGAIDRPISQPLRPLSPGLAIGLGLLGLASMGGVMAWRHRQR
jgi:hypothetical protein